MRECHSVPDLLDSWSGARRLSDEGAEEWDQLTEKQRRVLLTEAGCTDEEVEQVSKMESDEVRWFAGC